MAKLARLKTSAKLRDLKRQRQCYFPTPTPQRILGEHAVLVGDAIEFRGGLRPQVRVRKGHHLRTPRYQRPPPPGKFSTANFWCRGGWLGVLLDGRVMRRVLAADTRKDRVVVARSPACPDKHRKRMLCKTLHGHRVEVRIAAAKEEEVQRP